MDQPSLLHYLNGNITHKGCIQGTQFIELTLTPPTLLNGLEQLKNDTNLLFDFLYCETGVDIDQKLGVVYHLHSTKLRHACVVKCFTDNRQNALLPTASHLYAAAQYFEREIYDLLGIRFENHPNMKRIFLEDDFVGHPLRKDFEDNTNIINK